ncbi:SusC/RagA family TonB-linked outer membrane protein [Flavobacterium sp. CYK-4]|uniref:SusC/RagA family TonB-linked outer membrane protein n=1 Tax=Flavobacterium lotistagni TaxID=2709660 RepID=UPI00140BA16F|nr:SusC/RagA family TonB-linked outer membrane protein [Flavobacterium lotistagni]NHM06753.1 SusC/RagA family TonB-linked outer membrane protein [Flavobacterium lotistagni]
MKTIYQKLLFFMLLLPSGIFAQSTIEGTVLDKVSKQPIPGVNVLIQGSTAGSQTDFDGKFKIGPVKKGDKLSFSYVGYNPAVVAYNGEANLTVSLEEQANQLQEVMIQVGYGSAKKKDATGSVSLITSKDFNKGAIVSVDQLLAGKAAGVRITNNGGSPDSAPNIRIRGGASLNASNNPLIIIDGVPLSDLNPAGVNNPFTLINPNDIESFSILKDASATAIYGVRASNGVILITTKKGTSGEPQFNYSANVSMGKLAKSLDVMNGDQYMKFIQRYHPTKTNLLGVDDPNTTATDDLGTTDVIEGRILSNTDWEDQILRTAISTDHNFTARANLYKKIPFRFSLGYSNVQGLVKTSDYERLTYSFKMTPKFLNDDLKIDLNAKGTYTDKNSIDEGGSLGNALSMDPTKPVYDSSPGSIFGGYAQSLDTNNSILGSWNPLAVLNQRERPERALRFLGNIEFDYKLPFLRDLRAVLNLGIDASQARIRESYSNNAIAKYTRVPVSTTPNQYIFNPGLAYLENQTSTNTTMDAYLAYSKSLTGFITRFDAQAGYSYQNFKVDGNKYETQTDPVTGVQIPKVDPNDPNKRYYSPLNLQAFFARTNVDLLGKYLLTATMRADATSLYTAANRWGYFPALGAAWKIKEEAFLKDSKTIRDLKLRLGWGKTGQSNIASIDLGGKSVGYFPTQLLFTPGDLNSQYLPNITVYTPLSYSEDLTWETTITTNFGLDFELFKNGLVSGSVDVYKRKTTDLLAVVTYPAGGTVSGDFVKNIGEIDGEGFEFALNVKPISNDNFTWTLGGNIAYNYSTVASLEDRSVVQVQDSSVEGTGSYLLYHHVGDQPRSAWVFEQVYDANGDIVVGSYVDRNGDGQITNADRYYVATQPNWTYGFNTNISYKNWDFSANFRGQLGGQVYNLKQKNQGALSSAASLNGNALYNVLESVNPLIVAGSLNNVPFSDHYLEDATFLRCDNISLSYKFNKFLKKSTLKLTGSVNNAFLITNYSGQDPENFGAIDGNFYPRPITYTFGLSLDF